MAGESLVLEYADFGPPSCAEPLLGSETYNWVRPCSEDVCTAGCYGPDDRFDVHVVVFAGDRREAERRYPTVTGRSDYRLVTRAAALAHLDRAIASLDDLTDEDRILRELRDELRLTRTRIAQALPGPP